MPKLNRKLTETEIRNAKPQNREYKLYDEAGLRLVIRPSGSKVWQLPYKLHGKWNIYTIGKYGDVSSADARRQRDQAKLLIKDGIAPNEFKKAETQKALYESKNSFSSLGHEWLGKQVWTPKHAANITRCLENDVFKYIGHKPVKKITRQDVLLVLQRIEDRGALDVAKRTCQHCAAIFDYALLKGLCENNPAMGLSKTIKNYKRKNRAYLKENQLPEFIAKLNQYRGGQLVQLAMKMLMLTFVRPGELRNARWEEFDLKKAEWRIPAHRMKMRREHIVPLSSQALTIIKQVQAITGKGAILFPGRKNYRIPISDVTLTKCLIILGYGGGIATAHGMRATASTILNENGFTPDVIERQLAHIEENKVRAAYHHAEYLTERRKMMQWWGDYLAKRGL